MGTVEGERNFQAVRGTVDRTSQELPNRTGCAGWAKLTIDLLNQCIIHK